MAKNKAKKSKAAPAASIANDPKYLAAMSVDITWDCYTTGLDPDMLTQWAKAQNEYLPYLRSQYHLEPELDPMTGRWVSGPLLLEEARLAEHAARQRVETVFDNIAKATAAPDGKYEHLDARHWRRNLEHVVESWQKVSARYTDLGGEWGHPLREEVWAAVYEGRAEQATFDAGLWRDRAEREERPRAVAGRAWETPHKPGKGKNKGKSGK